VFGRSTDEIQLAVMSTDLASSNSCPNSKAGICQTWHRRSLPILTWSLLTEVSGGCLESAVVDYLESEIETQSTVTKTTLATSNGCPGNQR